MMDNGDISEHGVDKKNVKDNDGNIIVYIGESE